MKVRNHIKKNSTFLILSVLFFSAVPRISIAGGKDLQYWSRYLFKLYENDKFSSTLFAEARFFENISKLGLYQLSSRTKYKLINHLDIQMNYTYLRLRNSQDDYITHYRIEPEVNPYVSIASLFKINCRNRLEIRHIEGKGWDNTRYRSRLRLTVPLKNTGPFKSIYADTEYFYDFAAHEHLDQWTVPFGVNMSITQHTNLQLFYMVQHRKRMEHWFSNHVIGSMLTVKF